MLRGCVSPTRPDLLPRVSSAGKDMFFSYRFLELRVDKYIKNNPAKLFSTIFRDHIINILDAVFPYRGLNLTQSFTSNTNSYGYFSLLFHFNCWSQSTELIFASCYWVTNSSSKNSVMIPYSHIAGKKTEGPTGEMTC